MECISINYSISPELLLVKLVNKCVEKKTPITSPTPAELESAVVNKKVDPPRQIACSGYSR